MIFYKGGMGEFHCNVPALHAVQKLGHCSVDPVGHCIRVPPEQTGSGLGFGDDIIGPPFGPTAALWLQNVRSLGALTARRLCLL